MKNLVKMNNGNCKNLNSKNKIFYILYFLNIYQIIINQIIFNMYVNLWELGNYVRLKSGIGNGRITQN